MPKFNFKKEDLPKGINLNKSKSLQVNYRDEFGKSRSNYFPNNPEGLAEAIKFRSEIDYKKKHGISVAPENTDFGDSCTVQELMQMWLDYNKLKGNKLDWMREWARVFERCVTPIIGHLDVREVTRVHLTKIMADNWGNNKTATRNRYARYISGMFNIGIKHGFLEKNPMDWWVYGKESPRNTKITLNDLKLLLKESSPHFAWAVKVAWNIPVRPGEDLFGLTYAENVDFDKQGVHVYHNKVDRRGFIKCSEEFMQELAEAMLTSKSGYLIEYRGKRVKSVEMAARLTAKRAGIPMTCMYDIRHLWITTMLDNGVDMATIAYMAGTSVKQIIKTYYEHLNTQNYAVQVLPKLDIGGGPKQEIKPDLVEKSVILKGVEKIETDKVQ